MESTMSRPPAPPVPLVPGIDLTFRPRTYFGPLPLEQHLLAHVTGQERRELVRGQLESNPADLPLELAASSLDEKSRTAISLIHPAFMGGEYLPAFQPDETEIARISLASVTADQISVRARPHGRRIQYRIVDEYEGEYVQYACHPSDSLDPLTLAELVAMIDGACEDGGAAMAHITSNFEFGCSTEELRHFVRVSSEFYPALEAYYEGRIAAWFDENVPHEVEED